MRTRKSLIVLMMFCCVLGSLGAQSVGGGSRRSRVSEYLLQIRSNVSGARVEILGEGQKGNALPGGSSGSAGETVSGRTDYQGTFAQGNYTITVSAPGYETQSRIISLNQQESIYFQLKQLTASITVEIPPSFLVKEIGAREQIRIYDNGELVGNWRFETNPGQHTIRIESGGLMIQQTFNFQPGRTYRLEPSFNLSVQ